jgi:hypothetical protein
VSSHTNIKGIKVLIFGYFHSRGFQSRLKIGMNVLNTQSFLTLPYKAINASAVGSLQIIKIFADCRYKEKSI